MTILKYISLDFIHLKTHILIRLVRPCLADIPGSSYLFKKKKKKQKRSGSENEGRWEKGMGGMEGEEAMLWDIMYEGRTKITIKSTSTHYKNI